MKLRLLVALMATLSVSTSMAQTAPAARPAAVPAPAAAAAPDKATLAYAMGYDFGRRLADTAPGMDISAIVRALQDGYAKRNPTIDAEKLGQAMNAFQQQLETKAKADFEKASRENKAKSDAALAANRVKPGVTTLPSGIQYRILEAGAGAKPTLNSTVEMHYGGTLATTGQEFIRSFSQPKPLTGKVSDLPWAGMREIMLQMPSGSRWEVYLPAEKAWGNGVDSMRSGPGPNQALILDIKLISVK